MSNITEKTQFSNYRNLHSCEKCCYKTKSLFHMKNHVKRHQRTFRFFDCSKSIPETFHCMKCGLKTDLMVKFYPHMKGIHGVKRSFKITQHRCDDCNFVTFSVLKWLKHSRNECILGGKLAKMQFFKCKVCSYRFTRMLELKTHISNKHPEKVTWYTCTQCSFKTVWKGALKAHTLSHVDPTKVTWHECTFCSFKTTRKGNLSQHVKLQHQDIKWHECDQCSYKSKLKSRLTKHTLNKHTPADKILKCSDCRYKTGRFSNLQTHAWKLHMKTIKSNDTIWFECAQCSFKTKLKISLNQHVLQKHPSLDKTASKKHTDDTHSDKGSFKCPHCRYRGERLSHLKAHIVNQHPNDAKWYQCEQCSFKSVWERAFKKHKLSKHVEVIADDDSHKCKKCPYRTKERKNLEQHVIIKHTRAEDTKWLVCKSCPFKTKIKSHLNKHTLHLHMSDDEVYRCEFCKYKSMRLSTLNSHVFKKHKQ